MTLVMLRTARRWPALTLFVCLAVGCSSSGRRELPSETVHIMKLSALYGDFRRAHANKAPASVEELKGWARSLPKDKLGQLQIENLDDAFNSPRDNQPYQMAQPQANQPGAQFGVQRVVFYEKVGVNGKHMTVSSMGSFSELNEAELKRLVPGA
jgi:hypothetical protein